MNKEINNIIKKELKKTPLIIGIKSITKRQKRTILNLLKENNIKYEITILIKENPKKIIKASFEKEDKPLINKIRWILKREVLK